MEEKLECAARVTVRSAAARSIKSYKGGDAVLSGNKGENDLHFWDQSIAHYRALPVRRPASPRRRGMDWSTGASNSGSVIEELVYIGMRAELPATTYTRATGATRGALSYCLHSFIESFHFSLSPLSICLRKFEYSKNCSFTTDWTLTRLTSMETIFHRSRNQCETFFQDSTGFVWIDKY